MFYAGEGWVRGEDGIPFWGGGIKRNRGVSQSLSPLSSAPPLFSDLFFLTTHSHHPLSSSCSDSTAAAAVSNLSTLQIRVLLFLFKFKLDQGNLSVLRDQIIEMFQKCHADHPIGKLFGECTDLKIKLDRCFREEKALKRKANFEQSKKIKERLQAFRKETAETMTE